MLRIIIFYTIFCFYCLNSQPNLKNYDNWIFGKRAGITFNTTNGNPEALSIGDYNFTEGTSSFSDNYGNLLYYLDLVQPNSFIKSTKGVLKNNNNIICSSDVSNTGIFIKHPTKSNYLYLITSDAVNVNGSNLGINYCLIDTDKNEVIVKNKNLFVNSTEKIAAVYNQVDNVIWVVTHEYFTDAFKIIKIDENGLDENITTQKIGKQHKSFSPAVGTGRMNFSPNGTKLSVTIPFYDPNLNSSFEGEIQIFDFDPKTGKLSNSKDLDLKQNTYSSCFSQNGKVLYVKVDNAIYQYDLSICSWKEMIEKKFIIKTKPSPFFNAIERGPNGVIYSGRENNTFLDAIQYPNVIGQGCNYTENAVSLSLNEESYFRWGLPTVLNSFFNGEYDIPCVTEEDTEKDYSISFPNITCFGDKYSVIINSNRKEEFNAEFVKIYPNNENELISSINSQNYSVTFSGVNNIEDKSHFLEVFEVRIKTKSNNYDTLTFSLKYGFCCGNTVKNSNFGAIAAGSTCFTVEYFTDLDFRTSQSSSCPYLFTSYGQLASSSYAMWHNTNFDKTAKSAPFFLIGDPLPNIEQRAWYQENPTRVGTRYKFSAYVCNLEKISRAEENGRKLNIWLSIKNRFQDLKLKKIEDIRFEDDWVEISDEFIANDNSTELAIWILGESPDMKVPSYGFGIDNISLIPLPEYNLDVIKDTLVCVNESIKLENHFDGEISSINWFPITGLDEPNSLSPIVTPTETTTYTLKIHDRYYCEFTKNIVVSIDSCLDKCRPDVSIYLENSEIEIGKDFCINGIFVPECELNSYLDEIKLYFKFDPKLLKFKSS